MKVFETVCVNLPAHRPKGVNMQTPSPNEITRLLAAWTDGDQSALEQLVPLVQSELHRLAHRYMGRERPDHTLQTSALVNEAYIRLIDWKNVHWQNRAHFFAVSAQLMRRILVDFARERLYLKRGGGALQVSLSEAAALPSEKAADLVALDEALLSLSEMDPRKGKVVEMRFFGGLSVKEVAEVLKVSEETVLRDWRLAKVWLLRELGTENK
ncbi:MAG TPA: sigma-70 family RNA polymerase sigma factor [Pyrinomonadaceae bacterium]|nr:sigma-70 family RNA polymerase sigma factor [Pyrinomonadaceae bacterium]